MARRRLYFASLPPNASVGKPQRPRTITTARSPDSPPQEHSPPPILAATIAQCYLRLVNPPTYPLDRLSRYEYTLWRQVAQILFTLENPNRRKPQERRHLMRGYADRMPNEDTRRLDHD